MYVAGDTGSASLDKYRRPGDSTFFGGTYPALTWADYMATATKGQAVKQFDPPAYVNRDKAAPPDRSAPVQPSRTTQPSSQPSASQRAQQQLQAEQQQSSRAARPTRKPSASASKRQAGPRRANSRHRRGLTRVARSRGRR